jgi:MFS superfamily sulfate permease-like transporter
VILALRFRAPPSRRLVLVAGGIIAARAVRPRRRMGSIWSGTSRAGCRPPRLPSADLFREQYGTIGVAAACAAADRVLTDRRGRTRASPRGTGTRIDIDQESGGAGHGQRRLGQCSRACRCSTSLSASSLNESAGRRTPVASLVTGRCGAHLIVLAPLFSDLPKAVLGAVIIDAVVFGMIGPAEFAGCAGSPRSTSGSPSPPSSAC